MPKSIKNMLETLFPSLTKKIALAVIGISLVAGGSFAFFAQKTGSAMLDQFASTKAHGIMEKVQGVFTQAPGTGGREDFQAMLKAIINSPDVADAYVIQSDGNIIFSARPNDRVERFPLEEFHEISAFPNERHLTKQEDGSFYEYVLSSVTIKNYSGASGEFLLLKISINDLQSIALRHRTMNIIMTVLTFAGLALIIMIALSILVLRPITRIHALIRRIEGNVQELESGMKPQFPLLPETQEKDEIADLSRDFNNLIRRLNDANSKLFDVHQKQLEHADRLGAIGEMAASMAHEIKNPIAGVIGALQVFQSEAKENDPQKEILDEMKIQLERVNNAVNDLLSYARPRPPQFEELSISDLIRKTLTLLAPQLSKSNIKISTAFQEEKHRVLGDKKQLQQVFWNIMLNAIQAMDLSGELHIATCTNANSVTVTIADTGPGIADEELQNVFKAFFSTKHKGTGLGMTISKNIIEQHRGSIWLDSIKGKGVTVTITIPHIQSPEK